MKNFRVLISFIIFSILVISFSLYGLGFLDNYTYTAINNYYKINNNLEIETCKLIDVIDGDTIK